MDSINAIKVTADKNYICTEGIVNFAAVSTGNIPPGHSTIISYEWNVGNSSANVMTQGKHFFLQLYKKWLTKQFSVKSYAGRGFALIPVSARINVIAPVISVDISPRSGCAPATVLFSAKVNLSKPDSITDYIWEFSGIVAPIVNTGIANTIHHTYDSAISYYPSLKISTASGCTISNSLPKISYGTPPLGIKAYPEKDTVCGSDSIVVLYKALTADTYFN